MKLRRQTKQNDEEQLVRLKGLQEEMSKYKLLVEQVRLRERLKEKALESSCMSFVSEIFRVEKNISVFFVEEWLDNSKEFEAKKHQLEERILSIFAQSAQLRERMNNFLAASSIDPQLPSS